VLEHYRRLISERRTQERRMVLPQTG